VRRVSALSPALARKHLYVVYAHHAVILQTFSFYGWWVGSAPPPPPSPGSGQCEYRGGPAGPRVAHLHPEQPRAPGSAPPDSRPGPGPAPHPPTLPRLPASLLASHRPTRRSCWRRARASTTTRADGCSATTSPPAEPRPAGRNYRACTMYAIHSRVNMVNSSAPSHSGWTRAHRLHQLALLARVFRRPGWMTVRLAVASAM
jgi:hypothetical protein